MSSSLDDVKYRLVTSLSHDVITLQYEAPTGRRNLNCRGPRSYAKRDQKLVKLRQT